MRKAIITIVTIVFAVSLAYSQRRVEIQEEDGVYYIPCTVNGLIMRCVFDLEAAKVTISLADALFMLKNGYLAEEEIHGASYYQLANEEINGNTTISLRTLDIGGILQKEVEAIIIQDLFAPLILGRSALRFSGSVTIDGEYLVINEFISNEPSNTSRDVFEILDEAMKYFTEDAQNLALEKFEEAYEMDPNAFWLNEKYFFASAYYWVGDYEKAIKAYEWAAKSIKEHEGSKNPSDRFFISNIYLKLGLAYNKVEDYERALLNYERALQRAQPEDLPFIYSGISKVYSGQENFSKAIENVHMAIKYLLQDLEVTELDIMGGQVRDGLLGEYYYNLAGYYNTTSDRQNMEKNLILSAFCGYDKAIDRCRRMEINFESYRITVE